MKRLDDVILRIGAMRVSSHVNGPGKRLVLWLQGCNMACRGCFNTEFHDPHGGMDISADKILYTAIFSGVEGLTFTGGEPFLQAAALSELAAAARQKGLGIVCYSGFYLDEIIRNKMPGESELLEVTDLLIDGPFIRERQGAFAWRGSSNQNLRCLTERYRQAVQEVWAKGVSQTEILVGNSEVAITGIFPLEFWQRLEQKLNASAQ